MSSNGNQFHYTRLITWTIIQVPEAQIIATPINSPNISTIRSVAGDQSKPSRAFVLLMFTVWLEVAPGVGNTTIANLGVAANCSRGSSSLSLHGTKQQSMK
jgi:hypothetical protein